MGEPAPCAGKPAPRDTRTTETGLTIHVEGRVATVALVRPEDCVWAFAAMRRPMSAQASDCPFQLTERTVRKYAGCGFLRQGP